MTAVARRARSTEAEIEADAPGRCPSGRPGPTQQPTTGTLTHSVLGELPREEPEAALARLLDGLSDRAWHIRLDEAWAHADHEADSLPAQGWKLHVSATEASVIDMLHACAPVLLDAGCSFKVARTFGQVRTLTSPHCPRGNAGKVLTAYPATAEAAVRLAHLLDTATDGLAGPRILGDQPLRDGSLVHYRYGVFTGTPVLTHDGELSLALVAPDGRVVPDVRGATFAPPPWAGDPFRTTQSTQSTHSAHSTQSTQTDAAARVLLGDRFAVREAIRHANRGGLFRAHDVVSDAPVVIKQARAHVAADAQGRDPRDRLRHEWAMLHRLAPTGVVPEPIHLFEQSGDLFLAERDVEAPNLRTWVANSGTPTTRPLTQLLDVLRHVTEALATIHDEGIVLRDLSPNNVLVRADHTVAVVDPELAIPAGAEADLSRRSGTAAYASPEQLAGAEASVAMDLHALGALILFTLTGEDPLLDVDGSSTIREWLDRGPRRLAVPIALADMAIRLCGDQAGRPSLSEVTTVLDGAREIVAWSPVGESERAAHALSTGQPIDTSVLDEAIDQLSARLVREVSDGLAAERGRVAPASAFGETTLPTNVQHGAAGLLGVLVQCARLRDDAEARGVATRLAAWIESAPVPTGGAVGLHFGHAGPAWALAETAALVGDDALLERSVTRALRLTATFPGPDVTHGLAGLGLTLVRLWELTRDERVHARIAAIAAELAARATRDGHGVSWRTPADAPSTFAGQRFHGYAHGTAGIATFLWYAAELLCDATLLTLVTESRDSLARAALPLSDRRLLWGSSPEQPEPGLQHWCNGSSGVATFLARLMPESSLEPVVDGAARAMVAAKWESGIAYCHGLAGNADTLLDLADTADGDRRKRLRSEAADLLRIMWERRQVDSLGTGLSDEPGRITPDFGVGYSGALSTLLRLRYGGPRLWLPEGLR